MKNLRVSLVQGETRWHDPAGNRAYYADLIEPLHNITDLVILPETFTSGFSNDAIGDAETMEGPTLAWMRERADSIDAAICGSVQIRADGGVFNRLLFVKPDGEFHFYDKRHLFRYAREHERYAAGRDRLTLDWKGWRICPQVCYDLRFPVFSRNRFNVEREGMLDYDLLIYVANWPSARSYAWKTLLRARDREPVLRRRRQPRRHRRQRPELLGRQRAYRFHGPSAQRSDRRGSRFHDPAAGRAADRAPRSFPGNARRGQLRAEVNPNGGCVMRAAAKLRKPLFGRVLKKSVHTL